MFKKFTNGCVKLVQRFLPDAFVFCIILTIVVFIAAMPVAGMNPIEVANAWGSGVWGLLAFSMQMALVLVLGSALANAPAIKKLIVKLAGVPKTGRSSGFCYSDFRNLLLYQLGIRSDHRCITCKRSCKEDQRT